MIKVDKSGELTYHNRKWLKAQGCTWDPEAKTWYAPDEEILKEVLLFLNTEGRRDFYKDRDEALRQAVLNDIPEDFTFVLPGVSLYEYKSLLNKLKFKYYSGDWHAPNREVWIEARNQILGSNWEERFDNHMDKTYNNRGGITNYNEKRYSNLHGKSNDK